MSNRDAVPTSASLPKRAKKDDAVALWAAEPKSVLTMDVSDEDEESVAHNFPFRPHTLVISHASDEDNTLIGKITIHTSKMSIDNKDSGNEDTGSKGGRYRCQSCTVSCLRNDFLLNEEQADWCGKLYGVCIECKPEDIKPNQFKRIVRSRWTKRSYEFMGKSARQYTTTFARAQSFINAAEEYKNLPARKRHLHAVDLAKLMAFGMAHGYVHASVGTKLVYDVLLQDYQQACNALAKNPAQSAATVTPARGALSKEDREFLTQTNDCMALCFVCRYPTCGYYGRSDQWLKHESHHWYRCPMCTRMYAPSIEKAGRAKTIELLKFQKVVLLRNPFSFDWRALPTKWMPTMEDDFFSKSAELHAAQLETPDDAKLFLQGTFAKLSQLLKTQSISAPLRKFAWRPENEHVMNMAAGYGPKSYEKVKQDGFYGCMLSNEEQNLPPFDNYDEIVKIFAEMIKSCQAYGFECLQGRL